MAEKVYSNLKYADLFVQKIRKHVALKTEVRVSADMKGQKIVMTGFRDKAMEEKITERGGKVTSTVTGNTTALVVSIKTGKLTGKLEKADKLGVPIYSREEFWGKFLT